MHGKGSRLPAKLDINNIKIKESQKIIVLVLTIAHFLIFKYHIDTLCRDTSYKLYALQRIRKYLAPHKAKLLHDVFGNIQFSYTSIIWMFCIKRGYLKMQMVQYKFQKIVFNGNKFFEDLILHTNKVCIHQKQLRKFTTEIHKGLTDLSLEFIEPFYTVKEIPWKLRDGHILNLPLEQTTYYDINSILFRACQVRYNLLLSIKQSQSLLEFKTNI